MDTLTLQVFDENAWIDAATIATNDTSKNCKQPLDIQYSKAFIHDHFGKLDHFALSSEYPVDFYVKNEHHWPAFLLDIMPQGYGKRRLLRDWPNTTEASDDWYCLSIGAANPIGNMRVKEAKEYQERYLVDVSSRYDNGFSLDDVSNASAEFLEYLVSCHYGVAGSSGLQGECPKYLITQRKDGRFFIDGTLPDSEVAQSYILKQAKTYNNERDAFILMQEVTYLSFAKAIGLKTGDAIQALNHAILIPRFDRVNSNQHLRRMAQESLLTLMNKAGYGVTFYHQEAIFAMHNKCTNPVKDIAEYLLRDMVNLAFGNRDNHGRNTAFHRYNNEIAIAPVFDFAPMYLDQDAIARSAIWQHFEKLGRVDYVGVIQWLFDEVDSIKHNRQDFIFAMNTVLDQMEKSFIIAQDCGIDESILRQRKNEIIHLQEQSFLVREQLKKLSPSWGFNFG